MLFGGGPEPKFAFVFSKRGLPRDVGAERPKCPAPERTFGAFKLVGRLWRPKNLCGFRILVVFRGFYGNARNKACESNEADGYQMVAAPPLMHRKGHAGPRDQQRHQNDHGCCFVCAPSRGGVDERAFHLLLNALHRAGADPALARDLAYAFPATQLHLSSAASTFCRAFCPV
jgi:hypothetical protein